MKAHGHRLRGVWLWLAAIALVATPVLLYFFLPHFGLPKALVSGVVVLMIAKHLGLLAVLVGPVYAVFRRRNRAVTKGSGLKFLK
jgi:hypothetical protein